jgi:hypothetical protein
MIIEDHDVDRLRPERTGIGGEVIFPLIGAVELTHEWLGGFGCAKGCHFNARLVLERLDYGGGVLFFEAKRNGRL